jgi:phosphoribosylcarboxyaminoimidazole (NCAIR) mutase
MVLHTRRENGNQSKGKGPHPSNFLPYFSAAIFKPVLVVPVNTNSIEGLDRRKLSNFEMEESSPTLTA